ncbi:hypothetical protein GR247_27920 [Rhizobium leguminosarum]|nr:hypothetical protein [Rhizobium leguminosarum]NKK60659.1 hypothetical protein [Rhizobium leguminosarum bv. viciae]
METARVDVVYRPLRIGFALISDDHASFRKAVKLCNAFWGGSYNPILPVDRPEAAALVELFLPDFLVPFGDDPAISAFVARFPHLKNPLFSEELFVPASHGRDGEANLLDIQNLIVRLRDTPDWKRFLDDGVRVPRWAPNDPLADAFLAQFGDYPEPEEIGIDYGQIVSEVTGALNIDIPLGGSVPSEILNHPRIAHLTKFGLAPHYTSEANWIRPGLYVGNASNGADLVNFWNLRACGISLLFQDLVHGHRTVDLHSQYVDRLRVQLASQNEHDRQPSIWSRQEVREEAREAVKGGALSFIGMGTEIWNGLNIRPQQMCFGEESSLGFLGGKPTVPRITFALKDKPFSSDVWFHQQHLVASISLIGGRSDNHTFVPPFIPELNEAASRAMNYEHRSLRLERDRVGLVISAADHDVDLGALSKSTLIEHIFDLGGFSAKPSSSGLITRQLITRMGGADGARAFKIPGVRKLLKTFGPNASFRRNEALRLIGKTDSETGATFSDHRNLYIEPRNYGTDLTAGMVFSHLVEKGLFRIGVDLKCPACALTSWMALDALHQQPTCPLCGNVFDATRQLVEGDYAYRRSGVLGLEKNTQGAIPVVLLLQQLAVNLMDLPSNGIFSASYDLVPKDPQSGLPTCETDFCVVTSARRSNKTSIIIGECKDAGGTIDQKDVDNLRRVAEALPANRFDAYILLAKLAPFTDDEISLARALNTTSWMRRVIMLSARELEPYHLFDRTNAELDLELRGSSIEDLAKATHDIYFASAEHQVSAAPA